MHTIRIELLNEDAYELLRQLEKQHILRVVPDEDKSNPQAVTARTLVGRISPKATQQLLATTAQLRDEWEREF